MQTPTLPLLSNEHNSTTTKNSDDKPTQTKLRSSLRKILSKEVKTGEQHTLFEDDHNHFIFEEDNVKKVITKSIIPNNKQDTLKPNIKKELKFSRTEVHEVENWKEYNKPEKCCFCFFI